MSESNEATDEREALLARHRKEKKGLQAEIQGIKKSVPKGDKKQAKQAKIKIAEMETELESKHSKELEEFDKQKALSSEVSEAAAAAIDELTLELPQEKKSPKMSKAQKKRDKKAAKAKDRARQCEEAAQDYKNTARFKEEEEIKGILKEKGLAIKQIRSDGDCLYSAVADQVELGADVPELRLKVSNYMGDNSNDFMPFLTNNEGNQYSLNEFRDYCKDVQKQGVWGGQLELRALSHVLRMPIHVIQSGAPVIILGEEFSCKPIILTYHRHELGLGEHYNSVASENTVTDELT